MFTRKMRSVTIVALTILMAMAVSFCVANFEKTKVNAEQAPVFSVTVINGDETTTVDSQTAELIYTLPTTENVVDGYTFLGWYVGNNFVEKTQTQVTLTKNTTITALYAKLNFIGGSIRKEAPTGVRFKFELELYKIDDAAIMSYVGSTIRGEYLLKTSVDNKFDIGGYQIDGNKIAMNVVVINDFDAKNNTEHKTFCDKEIDVSISLTACGTDMQQSGKRSLIYISSMAFANGEFEKQEDAEKYGCVAAELEYMEVYDETDNLIGYSVNCVTNNQTATAAVIPATHESKPVTSIDYGAFHSCTSLTSVTIPNSVTKIGYDAFKDCTSLTNVTIPDSVTSIDDFTFENCTSLTSVTIPDSVTSIGGEAFSGCTGLTSVEIPNSVTSIGGFAFKNCTGLTNVEIPNSLTTIGGQVFSGCTNLTSVTIPDSVTSIDSTAFEGCTSIEYNEYGNALYLGNDNNPYSYLVKAKETTIASCEINSNTKTIGESAFYGCKNLASVTIGENVTSIGNSAFRGCTGLTNITIPNSITFIDNYAFDGCTGLTSITVDKDNKTYQSINNCLINKTNKTLILGCKNSVIPTDGVTSIGDYAFNGCTGLTSVTIPDSVTSIGDYAFNGCTGLTSVTIPDNVTSIGGSAFESCTGLASVTIGNGLISIGNWVFKDCTSLASVTIGNKVTSIGEHAFGGCTGLESITIPDNVTSIGGNAFSDCSKLTSVTIGNGVTNIQNYAFIICTSLTSVTIPDSVTSIGNGAFYGCTGLTSIVIGNEVTSIGKDTFQNCTNLTKVYYHGTADEWNNISIGTTNNDAIRNDKTRYYYSENQPTTEGNYWHYVDSKAVEW